MARHLGRSFVLTSTLFSFAHAGPCRPSASSEVIAPTTTATTTTETVDVTKSFSTTFSVSFTIETSQAESIATTDTAVAVGTSSEMSIITDSQIQTITTTTTSDVVSTTTFEASTTTAAPVQGCVNNLKNPAPGYAVCGTKGIPMVPSDDFLYLGKAAAGTRLDCYKSCAGNPNCLSFTVEENVSCELYAGSTGATGILDTPWKWYELDCFCNTV
ncbi:hypothetical protein FPOAC1_007400 [Fusarium poae]|uniref:hypothetical protein n=1 Tax=Fusarium poae TaxID=36050 RepID=UPI001CEA0964|nr:hypothetical protein FPOAC1_007400 [Fusarium poae]KAG8668039.1 hypothetical protein FPOAC1_007400 [Fusarium poae]